MSADVYTTDEVWAKDQTYSRDETYSKDEVDELIADLPDPTPSPPASGGLAGVVALDSFAGSNWDAKLDAALSHAAAQTYIPYIQFPAGKIDLNKGGRPAFTGMKLLGPNALGAKNLEISNGKPVNHKVMLNSGIGTGAKSLFVNGGTIYDIDVAGLAFQGTNTQQFWSQPSGTMYACRFDSLNFYGMGSVFGNSNEKCLMTQVVFSGMWTVLGSPGQKFNIGGSDNDFWVAGYCNMGGNHGDPNADYYFRVNALGKTRIGSLYLTAGEAKGIRISGSSEGSQIEFRGVRFEGYHSDTPSVGLVLIDSGNVAFFGGDIGYSKPVITQNGGNLKLLGVNFLRGSSQNRNDPLVIQNGGTLQAHALTISDGGPINIQGANVRGDRSVLSFWRWLFQ